MKIEEIKVIKIGTEVFTRNSETEEIIALFAKDAAQVLGKGHKVVVVTSGAIGEGKKKLPDNCPVFFGEGQDSDIVRKQAQASVGQGLLMASYEREFARYGYKVGQMLATQDDFARPRGFLNFCSTIQTLLLNGVTPIINENDVMSSEAIIPLENGYDFDDNDSLAGLITRKLGFSMLIIITKVLGVFFNYPPQAGEEPIAILHDVPGMLKRINPEDKSGDGRGGMKGKLKAAMKVNLSGIPVRIVGWESDVVSRIILANEQIGTLLPGFSRTGSGKGLPAINTTKL